MGPGANAPGNNDARPADVAEARLQWGRELTLPEISPAEILKGKAFVLQWGRELTLPEIRTLPATLAAQNLLQWGRELTLPEMTPTGSTSEVVPPASMGPGANAPGNDGVDVGRDDLARLQWGRELTLPEICRWWCSQPRQPALQWGRELTLPEMRVAPGLSFRPPGFNGAGS